MNVLSKLKTGLWYLANPKFIPDLFVKAQQFIFNKKNEQSEEASIQWCEKSAVTPIEGFHVFFPGAPYFNMEKEFPEEYRYAVTQEENCPFKMGGAGCIDIIYSICEATNSLTAIETGVAYGWSTFAILLSLKNRLGSKLISIDMPYAKAGNDDYVGCVVNPSFYSQWTLLREPDITGVPRAINNLKRIDICHYDSDKSFSGRMRSLPLLWTALQQNGILISDDISDNLGFKTFCDSVNQIPVIVKHDGKYVGILKK